MSDQPDDTGAKVIGATAAANAMSQGAMTALDGLSLGAICTREAFAEAVNKCLEVIRCSDSLQEAAAQLVETQKMLRPQLADDDPDIQP